MIVIFMTLLGLISKSVIRHPFASISLILLLILFSVSSRIDKLREEVSNMKADKYIMDNRINRLMEDSVMLHISHETDTVYVVRIEYIYIRRL